MLNFRTIKEPLAQGAQNTCTTKGALGQGTVNVCATALNGRTNPVLLVQGALNVLTTKGALKTSPEVPWGFLKESSGSLHESLWKPSGFLAPSPLIPIIIQKKTARIQNSFHI